MDTSDPQISTRHSTARDVGRALRVVVVLGLLAAIIAVGADNRDDVRLGYVFGDASGPVWLVLVLAAIAGMIIGWLVSHVRRSRS